MTTVKHKTTGKIYNVDSAYANRVKQQVTVYLKDRDDKTESVLLPELMEAYEPLPDEVGRPKTVYDLKEGDKFWALELSNITGFDVGEHEFNLRACHLREIGDIFLTKEEAEKELARRKAKQILLRDTKGFKPDWSTQSDKYAVSYGSLGHKLMIGIWVFTCPHDGPWFDTKEDAADSIKAHPNEWKTYLGVEE